MGHHWEEKKVSFPITSYPFDNTRNEISLAALDVMDEKRNLMFTEDTMSVHIDNVSTLLNWSTSQRGKDCDFHFDRLADDNVCEWS